MIDVFDALASVAAAFFGSKVPFAVKLMMIVAILTIALLVWG